MSDLTKPTEGSAQTATCRACGHPLSGTETFCGNCGVRASVMHAPVSPPVEPGPVAASTQPLTNVPEASAGAPWYRRDLTSRQLKRAGLIILALAILAGVVGYLGADRTSPPLGELVAEGPITAEGGSLKFEKGGEVQVPQGAVSQTQTISVRRAPTRRAVRFPDGTLVPAGALPLYYFGPFNITFLRPITIVLPISLDATGADIYLFTGGRLVFVAQRPNVGGTVTIQVIAFRAGRIILAQT